MDRKVKEILEKERRRQREGLVLIASENYVSPSVLELLGSEFTNKYSEGYPGRRYYAGNEYVDEVESLAIERVKRLFGLVHANVQAHSGSPANLAIISALCEIGEPILSQSLSMGGHLSMGQEASFTGRITKASFYGLTDDGEVDWEELLEKAKKIKPKIIFCGGTAYTRIFDFEKYAKVADEVGAWLVADISHIAGLVAGGVHPSPVEHAHVLMFTTHKTLRGPRGAVIGVTKKGLAKDGEICGKIDRAVFPGLQGGPHENNIAALAQALREADSIEFKKYSKQVLVNAQVLAKELVKFGFDLVGGETENHMIWINLEGRKIDGWALHMALEQAGIYVNKQTVPADRRSPFYPSGFRLGTAALTTRGMGEEEMKRVASLIEQVTLVCQRLWGKEIGSEDKKEDQEARKKFKESLLKEGELERLKNEVRDWVGKFPEFKRDGEKEFVG